MNLPKISVITPSLNQAAYLEETILSVINQNYPNLEHIIIDGGSNDGSLEIIKKYADHLAYWISEKDTGQSEALNKGFKRCTGEIVTWLCSDDKYVDNVLHKVAQYFNEADFSLLYGRSVLYSKEKEDMLVGINNEKDDIPTKCFAFVPFPQPSTFFRREVLLDQGYLDETLHYGMDHDLFNKIILNYNIKGVDDIFSIYRYHDKSKSNYPINFTGERTKVFSKVLRSFSGTEQLINILKQIGYYHEGSDYYATTKHLNIDLKRSLIYFLEVQMHYYYQALDKKNALTLANFLLQHDDSYINKEEAKKIKLRSTWLNKHLISIMRNFT